MDPLPQLPNTLDDVSTSQYFLAESQRIAKIGSYYLDVERRLWTSNGILDGIFGITANFHRSTDAWLRLVHPEDLESCGRHLEQVLRQEHSFDLTYRIIRHNDGACRWVHGVGEVYCNSEGQPLSMIGVIHDITEAREALLERERREDELFSLFENTPIATCLLDENAHTLRANKACRRFLQENDSLLGAEPGLLISCLQAISSPQGCGRSPDCSGCALRNSIRDCLGSGRSIERLKFEKAVKRQGVTLDIVLLISAARIELAGKRRLLLSLEDITEFHSLEQRLNQSRKLEAIGQLAGGVAHDFNNILTGIILHAQLLSQRRELNADLRHEVVEISENAKRAAALTRQLLMFSRRTSFHPQALDLNLLLRKLLGLLCRVISEVCQIELHPSEGVLFVNADENMIEQVVMNLVINARDAMPQGGCIHIYTRSVSLDEPTAQTKGLPPGDYACFEVRDTGCGMDAEVLDKIFEPFFTTKAPGKGTGLGLSTVHGIVAHHKGWIDVESQPDLGASFRIHLPLCPEAGIPRRLSEPNTPRGSERILLIEDDTVVAHTLGIYLNTLGYHVTACANGVEALATWKQQFGSFELVFTDMVMPNGLSGLDILRTLRRERPRLPAVILTGYSKELLDGEAGLDNRTVVLSKPSEPYAIGAAIRAALNASTGRQ
jgi:PAS domain S-box-containing protein